MPPATAPIQNIAAQSPEIRLIAPALAPGVEKLAATCRSAKSARSSETSITMPAVRAVPGSAFLSRNPRNSQTASAQPRPESTQRIGISAVCQKVTPDACVSRNPEYTVTATPTTASSTGTAFRSVKIGAQSGFTFP